MKRFKRQDIGTVVLDREEISTLVSLLTTEPNTSVTILDQPDGLRVMFMGLDENKNHKTGAQITWLLFKRKPSGDAA